MQRGALGGQNITYRGSLRWEEWKGQRGWGCRAGRAERRGDRWVDSAERELGGLGAGAGLLGGKGRIEHIDMLERPV